MIKDANKEDKKLGPVEDVLYETEEDNQYNDTIEQADESLDLETDILRALASADRGETLMTKVLGTQYVEGFHSH